MGIEGRFSRATVAAYIREMRNAAADEYKRETGRAIDPGNGTAQIPGRGDRDALVRATSAYAQWRALDNMLREVEGP